MAAGSYDCVIDVLYRMEGTNRYDEPYCSVRKAFRPKLYGMCVCVEIICFGRVYTHYEALKQTRNKLLPNYN